MIHESFITAFDPKIDLNTFRTNFEKDGYDIFDYIDMEDLYVVNDDLTLFSTNQTSVVNELKNLNETDILSKIVNITKVMKDGGEDQEILE